MHIHVCLITVMTFAHLGNLEKLTHEGVDNTHYLPTKVQLSLCDSKVAYALGHTAVKMVFLLPG